MNKKKIVSRPSIAARWAVLLLSTVILVSLLAGCQSAVSIQSTVPETTSESVSETTSESVSESDSQNAATQEPSPSNSDGSHTAAAVYIAGGERDSSSEYTDDSVMIDNAGSVSGTSASGVLLTSDAYTATGFVITDGSSYTIGGSGKNYTVYTDKSKNYIGTGLTAGSGDDLLGTFDSVLLFTLDDKVDASAETGSSGIDVDSGSTLNINNAYVQVDGAQRYAVSNYNDGTLIVNDSYLVTTGDADGKTSDISLPFSNEPLLISGSARTNFSIGATKTYYFNSHVVAEGWAALSTDSATGNGLDLYAYNTIAETLNGGYSTYADTNCRVWLYGSSLSSVEIGAIISKNGQITAADGSAAGSDITAYNTGSVTSSGTTITGGRNAVMIHTPDMSGEGTRASSTGVLTASGGKLLTDSSLKSTYDYSAYSDAVKAYVDYVSGDVILVKSTSAGITLENTEMTSYNGVLVHTVLNNDSMSNFLSAGDNADVDPVSVSMKDMDVTGGILHEDYQRNMEITLDNTSLTGAIEQGTYDSWKTLWSGKGVTSANWLPDASWNGSNNLSVTLKSGSTWTVTGESTLTSLSIDSGATVAAPAGKTLSMMVNGAETVIESGATYSGTIVITLK